MSRRGFLAVSSAALTAPVIAAAKPRESSDEDLGKYLELSNFRPKPKVRIMSAVVRKKPPYWLGWPGASYDLEKHRKKYAQDFAKSAKKVGVELLEEKSPLESQDAVSAFIAKLRDQKPDAVLLHLQHLSYWHWIDAITEANLPTIVFAPIGTSFTTQIVEISRRRGIHVISSLDSRAVEQAFRMARAKRQLEETRLLVVSGDKRHESVMEHLGTKVRYIPRRTYHELFARMPETDEVRDVARMVRRHAKKIIEPSKQDTLNAARSYITAKRLLWQESANALTTDCLGMVSMRKVPTPPCIAASLFQDAGVTYGCEADLFAAMSLLLVSYLFDRPGFQQDPVAETVKNVLLAAHCTCGTRLNGFDQSPNDYILRSHSESNIGAAPEVLWDVDQPVTLVRFRNPHELILDSGKVVANVNTPPAGGCRTSIEIAMDRMEDARDVIGFHQVVFYGNHRRDVEAFCQLYGVGVINSPEKAPKWTAGISTVTTWNAIGPFDHTDHKGHNTAYPPEKEVNLDAIYKGVAGPVKWKVISEKNRRGYVNLVNHFTPNKWVTAYALNYLYTEHETDAQLRIGSNDSLKVWLGGKLVWQYDEDRSAKIDDDIIPVKLKAGWTPVLLKISQTENEWGFYFRITDAQGNPAKDVMCVLSP